MGLWQVVAPDKERVVICEGYIVHELKHGSYVRAEHIVKLFPQFFVRILEQDELEQKESKVDVKQDKVEQKESKVDIKQEPKLIQEKKKPGRKPSIKKG